MIVVVSDVHLGSDVGRSLKKKGHEINDLDSSFLDFLDFARKDYLKTDKDVLVLLGDVFDFWRMDSGEVLINNQEVVSRLKGISKKSTIHYVVGNHDFSLKEMWGRSKRIFHTLDKRLDMDISGQGFTFIHGYQLEVLANPYNKSDQIYEAVSEALCSSSGVTGRAASRIWSLINPSPKNSYLKSVKGEPTQRLKGKHNAIDRIESLAQAKCRSLYTGADEWLIYGHTHRAYIDNESKTVNTGSWGRNGADSKLDYLTIEAGKPKLREWS